MNEPLIYPLDDVAVLDLSKGIAGAYCAKLLADGGANVVKVEAADGDPLRRHGVGERKGLLHAFLRTSTYSAVLTDDEIRDLAIGFDLVIDSSGPGPVRCCRKIGTSRPKKRTRLTAYAGSSSRVACWLLLLE